MEPNTRDRMLKGARLIGDFWRAGDRCAEGWRTFEVDADPAYAAGCACGERSTRFCKAKRQWLVLAKQGGRDLSPDPFGLALAMTASEWDATGLTMRVEFPEVGTVAVGAKGSIPMKELAKLTTETLPPILLLFKNFPGSQVSETVYAGTSAKPEEPFPEKEEGDVGEQGAAP